jgi:hypothetical protein
MCSLLNFNLFLTPTLCYADIVTKAGGFEFLFELRDHRMPTSVPARNTSTSIIKATKRVLALCPLFPLGSDERHIMRLFAHYLPQLLHAHGLRLSDIRM